MRNSLDGERTRCEVWTRVMGYHRPVHSWNPGKQSEHRHRLHFELPADIAERIAFDQGVCAGRVGWGLEACGYPVGSPLRAIWEIGHSMRWHEE